MCKWEGEGCRHPWSRRDGSLLFGTIGIVLREMFSSAVHKALYPLDKLRKACFEQERVINFWGGVSQVSKDETLCTQDGKDHLDPTLSNP